MAANDYCVSCRLAEYETIKVGASFHSYEYGSECLLYTMLVVSLQSMKPSRVPAFSAKNMAPSDCCVGRRLSEDKTTKVRCQHIHSYEYDSQ